MIFNDYNGIDTNSILAEQNFAFTNYIQMHSTIFYHIYQKMGGALYETSKIQIKKNKIPMCAAKKQMISLEIYSTFSIFIFLFPNEWG